MRITKPGSARCEKSIDDVEIKIEELEWKTELQKMRAQIRGIRSNVCKRAKDYERMDFIEQPFTNEIMEMPLPPNSNCLKRGYIVVRGTQLITWNHIDHE